MDQRTQFLIQVLEKIGGPLTAAVTVLPGQNDGDMAQDAKRVAELLNRSVQLGLSVAEGMNVRDEAQADGGSSGASGVFQPADRRTLYGVGPGSR